MRPGPKLTYLDVTLPLRRLTAMNLRFNWIADCQQSFDRLNELLTTSTMAVHWDPDKKTRIYVDHGPAGLGGTIAQNHTEPGDKPVWGPVHYCSRALTKSECNYGIHTSSGAERVRRTRCRRRKGSYQTKETAM